MAEEEVEGLMATFRVIGVMFVELVLLLVVRRQPIPFMAAVKLYKTVWLVRTVWNMLTVGQVRVTLTEMFRPPDLIISIGYSLPPRQPCVLPEKLKE